MSDCYIEVVVHLFVVINCLGNIYSERQNICLLSVTKEATHLPGD